MLGMKRGPTLALVRVNAAPAAPERSEDVEESEAALVTDVLSGSEAAVRRFVRRYSPVLLATIDRVLGHAGRAGRGDDKDVLQQVFLEVFRSDMRYLRGWDPARGKSLRGYLCVLADHRARDALRERGPRLVSLEAESPGEDVAATPPPEQDQRLRQVLDRFYRGCDEDERRLFSWYFLEGRAIAAIAADLKLSPAAAHQRCHRLRTRLLDLLVEADAGEPRAAERSGGVVMALARQRSRQ